MKNYLSKNLNQKHNVEVVSVSSLAKEQAKEVANVNFNSGSQMQKTILRLFFVFFFGSANIFAQVQVLDINSYQELERFARNVNNGYSYANYWITLTADIGDPNNPFTEMIGNDDYYFEGQFFGNGHRIYVDINSDNQYVGLFSQFGGTLLSDLIVAGSVTGGYHSEFVGGFAGVLLQTAEIHRNTNLADVTGHNPASTVGGITGAVFVGGGNFIDCVNNGTITGGKYVSGIVANVVANILRIDVYSCRNAGTIQGIEEVEQYCISGIVGYGSNISMFHCVNIDKILSRNSDYAGGIVAYLVDAIQWNDYSALNVNSGIVDGARTAVGGLVGWLENATISNSINTNWVEGTAQYSGAVVGFNRGAVNNCFFDNQMSILEGIGYGTGTGYAVGRPTVDMIGNNLGWPFTNIGLTTHPQLYPRQQLPQGWLPDHPIALLAAAPIYLQNDENVTDVRTNFYVSNWMSFPFPPQNLINIPYQWGSLSNGGIISIPLWNAGNNAIVNGRGQDTLRVWIDDPSQPVYYEKVIPVNVP